MTSVVCITLSSRPSLSHFCSLSPLFFFFFFNDPATTEIYTLSLHDALPIYRRHFLRLYELLLQPPPVRLVLEHQRSEEHTSELQSRVDLVCRLLLEKKKKK